jgi:hypothetical protein
MATESGSEKVPMKEEHKPIERSWRPAVQGGYKPIASAPDVVVSPPTGGSGVKAPKPPEQ